MSGPNYVLDKGYTLSNAGAAQSIYRFVKFAADENKVVEVSAITDKAIGVCQQRVDAADSATGNVQVDVRLMGISKVEAAGVIALMDFVAPSANGRAQVAVSTQYAMGIAFQAATAAGQWIDVFLLPYIFTLGKA
jgi:ABC-type transporter Mla MlaB component